MLFLVSKYSLVSKLKPSPLTSSAFVTNINALGFTNIWSGTAYEVQSEQLSSLMTKLNQCIADISAFDAILLLRDLRETDNSKLTDQERLQKIEHTIRIIKKCLGKEVKVIVSHSNCYDL